MRRSKAAIRATYEAIADSFAASQDRPWPEVVEFIDDLRPNSQVLDLGSGNGRHASVLAARCDRVVGLDFSRRLLVVGRRLARDPRRGHIEWVEGEATMLPFRDAAFDAAICVAVLHHLPSEADRVAALRQVRRVLRPGSSLFVSVWSRDQPRFASTVDSDVEVPWTMPDGSAVPRFYHLFRSGELERLIIESGLQGETFFQGSGNYFARAKKDG